MVESELHLSKVMAVLKTSLVATESITVELEVSHFGLRSVLHSQKLKAIIFVAKPSLEGNQTTSVAKKNDSSVLKDQLWVTNHLILHLVCIKLIKYLVIISHY